MLPVWSVQCSFYVCFRADYLDRTATWCALLWDRQSFSPTAFCSHLLEQRRAERVGARGAGVCLLGDFIVMSWTA